MNHPLQTRLRQLEQAREIASGDPATEAPLGLPDQSNDPETVRRGLIDHIRMLHTRTLGLLQRAERAGRAEVTLRSIREARSNLELIAKLTGQLDSPGASMQVQAVIIMPNQLNSPSPVEAIEISATQ